VGVNEPEADRYNDRVYANRPYPEALAAKHESEWYRASILLSSLA
jgi:hypothetical protein